MQKTNISKRSRGTQLEKIAKEWWLKRGATFLTENFYAKGGEIDLIFEEKNTLVFIEVRTSGVMSFEHPDSKTLIKSPGPSLIETVTPEKQRRITLAARQYLTKYKGKATEIRFDVMTYESSQRDWTHWPGAW
jgi:putative endonuclease